MSLQHFHIPNINHLYDQVKFLRGRMHGKRPFPRACPNQHNHSTLLNLPTKKAIFYPGSLFKVGSHFNKTNTL
jgi:hypothetical protein